MPDFRRGTAAIQAANESSGGFQPFAPSIRWTEDKEEKYVLFLTPIEEVPLVELHEFIPIGEGEKGDGTSFQKYGFYISRKDQAIGEDYDLLEDRNGFKPKQRNLAVAVELEPVMKTVSGRQRPKGFEVKTREFDRRIDPEDENSDKETVLAPVVGVTIQSPFNFFGYLASFHEGTAPVEETPFKVQRRGKTKDTTYDFVHYLDQAVDLSALIENVDGISYLNEQMDEIIEKIDNLDDAEAGRVIADYLLDARLEELADGERYEEEILPLEDLKPKYGNKDKYGNESKKRPSRPSRRSQRSRSDNGDGTDADGDDTPTPKPDKKDKFDRMKERAAKKRSEASAA